MKPKTHINCKNPGCQKIFQRYNTFTKYCSNKCKEIVDGIKEQKARTKIKPVSDKRKVEKAQYDLQRILFFKKPENALCVIKGTNCTIKATCVEHSMHRSGYADEEKRNAGISLYLDVDYWKPSCSNCNIELENNTELSLKHQSSRIHGGTKEDKRT